MPVSDSTAPVTDSITVVVVPTASAVRWVTDSTTGVACGRTRSTTRPPPSIAPATPSVASCTAGPLPGATGSVCSATADPDWRTASAAGAVGDAGSAGRGAAGAPGVPAAPAGAGDEEG